MARTYINNLEALFTEAGGGAGENAAWANAGVVPVDVDCVLDHHLGGTYPTNIKVSIESVSQWPLAGFIITDGGDGNHIHILASDCPPGGIDGYVVRVSKIGAPAVR